MPYRRRAVLAGLAAGGLAALKPAWAQFNTRDRIGGGASGGMWDHGGARRDLSASEEDDEIAIGRANFPAMIREGGGLHPDPRLQKALQRFMAPLVAASDRAHLPWTMALTTSMDPNARASFGGTVVVFAGIISMCETPGELASVLAHEIGHVDLLHMISDNDLGLLKRQAGIGSGALTGATQAMAPEARAAMERSMEKLLNISFTRMEEEEADKHISRIFDRVGLDLRWAESMFRKLALVSDDFSFETGLTQDHPAPLTRAQLIRDQMAFYTPPSQERQLPGWAELKAPFPTPPKFRFLKES